MKKEDCRASGNGRLPGAAVLAALLCLWSLLAPLAQAGPRGRKVVLIAGKKSHGPGDHEYEKGARLLAHCLQNAPSLRGYRTEVHLKGWPENPRTLDDADTIVLFSDGSDHREADHPLLHGDRLETLGRAMRRGAGLVALHYTVFVPARRGGPEFLEWLGGYFDYESGSGTPPWYSRIRTAATEPVPATPAHPIARGLEPFQLREEYYYRMRFREPDARRTPILTTTIPGETGPQEVAWAVERKDGGRGFGFTGGHFHSNWQVENFRKMVLNAIVWTAKGDVPPDGVECSPPADPDVIRALILTGHQHPAHDWRSTTAALREALGADRRFQIQTTEDPELLAREDLAVYDVIIQNYNNWERPTLSDRAKAKLLGYVRRGGALVLIHFANGAFLEWKEYRRLSRRVWLDGLSGHDAHGPFRVTIRKADHPITAGLQDYDTVDELYFRQHGVLPIEPLVTARSNVTGADEPMAYAFEEGKGRVFQTLLGHDAASIRNPGTAALIRRGTAWAAGRATLPSTQ